MRVPSLGTGTPYFMAAASPLGSPTVTLSASDHLGSPVGGPPGGQRTGPFVIQSSFTVDSPVVLSMIEQVREGRAIPFYELAQGLVDHGLGHEPPPRILLHYEGGRTIVLGENGIDRKNLKTIEFRNAGPGLAPEDLAIIRHEGGPRSLGQHGQGTSVALTYFALLGASVTVESNYQGQKWTARTGLALTESGKTRRLVVQGRWFAEDSNETRFVIEAPGEEFITLLERLPSQFLYANRMYPNAVLVGKDPSTAPPRFTASLLGGQVTCLTGLLPWEGPADDRYPSQLYVDGLLVHSQWGDTFLFPWCVEGFREQQYPHRISRSADSRTAAGSAGAVIALSLRRCHDREILSAVVRTAVEIKGDALPAELTRPDLLWTPDEIKTLDPETARLAAEIWRDLYGNARITDQPGLFEEVTKRDREQVLLVRGGIFDLLKEAGIPEVSRKRVRATGGLSVSLSIDVPYAESEDRLIQLFREAGRLGAEIQVVKEDGRRVVQVLFPYSFFESDDLIDPRKPGIHWARSAAVVAHRSGLAIGIASVRGEERATVRFDVVPSQRGGGVYETPFEIEVSPDEIYRDVKAPTLVISLSGGQLQEVSLTSSTLQRLKGEADTARERLLKEEAKRLARLPKFPRVIPPYRGNAVRKEEAMGLGLTRRDTFWVGASVLSGVLSHVVLGRTGIPGTVERFLFERNENGIPLGIQKLDYGRIWSQLPSSASGKPGFESVHPKRPVAGYYREFTSSKFSIDWLSGRGEWMSFEAFQPEQVPRGMSSRDYTTVLRIPVADSAAVPVREGERIVALEATEGVQLLREAHTGDYRVIGSSKEVTLYAAPGQEKRWNSKTPHPLEKKSFADPADLSPHWQGIISTLNGSSLSYRPRAALMIYEWGRNFRYNTDPELDPQVVAPTHREIAAKIINTQHGNCNIAAAGLAILLRAVGIPSRLASGRLISPNGTIAGHAWTEFWDGTSWIPVEPQERNFDSMLVTGLEGVDLTSPRVMAMERDLLATTLLIHESRGLVERLSETPDPPIVVPPLRRPSRGEGIRLVGAAAVSGFVGLLLGRSGGEKKLPDRRPG